jgi:hypothetical protein
MATQDMAVEEIMDDLESEQVADESLDEQDLGAEQEASTDTQEMEHDESANLAAVAKERNEYRRKFRRAQSRVAELEAVNVLPEEQRVTVPDAKSPIDIFAEQNADDPDAPIPLSVQLAQQKFEKSRQELTQQAQAANQSRQAMAQSIATAKVSMDEDAMGEGLDFDAMISAGGGFLTEHDKAAVRAAGPRAGKLLYQICREYAQDADTEAGDRVRAALQPTNTPKPKAEATTKTTKQAEPPTRREALQRTQKSAPTAAERLGIRFPDG